IAAPMKGPVQGVAMKAASTPVQKEPAEPGFSARLLPALTLLNSKSPARLKAMAVTSTSSHHMMRGSRNCKAQTARKVVVEGKSVSVRVDIGGGGIVKTKN